MPHPLVQQLRFTRTEFTRGLAGVTDAEARQRFQPMNSIGWVIGHLAGQEQRYWLTRMQGYTLLPELEKTAGSGQPASTPPLDEMWAAWHAIVSAVDPYLDTFTTETLQQAMVEHGKPTIYSIGTMLQRQIYHYWVHLGESLAIRQLLGHKELPEFVGDIHSQAPYQPA